LSRDGITEILNLQPRADRTAKPYQVRQVRDIILRYRLDERCDREVEVSADYRYEIVIYWSELDQTFVAEVPELPGCMADGPTYEAALREAGVVIREWVSAARELGREVPQPAGRRMFA
jgi:predicted RNase H-like HicB family nuclease